MREIFSDKTFIQSKATKFSKFVLIISILFFFLPLLVLPFFNHPSTDDYFCGYNLHDKNFWQYQSFIYTNWGGRFSATFAGSLFAYHDFLYNHYYLHSLLFLCLDFISIFLLINTFNKFYLEKRYSIKKIILFSCLLLALEICCLPQASTFIFWFSSAVTYQLPVILLQIQITLLLLHFNSIKMVKIICTILFPLLVFIIVGFNELFIAVELFLLVLAFYLNLHQKNITLKIVCVIAFLLSAGLIVFSPGNKIRINEIVAKKFYVGFGSVIYHSFETLWSIYKNPLFWFVSLFVFLYAYHYKNAWKNNINIKKILKIKWPLLIGIFLFMVTSISLPVILLKGGIVPDRYLNAVCYLMVLLMLFYLFIAAVSTNLKGFQLSFLKSHSFVYLFLSAGLIFNNYIIDAYKSIMIAPTYNVILSNRENILKHAAQTNKIAVVNTYDAAVINLIQTKYNSGTATFQQLIQQKPPLLFFKDDLTDTYTIDVLKKYYRLDSIAVNK